MKKIIALAAATVGMATFAAAQDSSNMNNISLRGGIAFPTSNSFNGTLIGAGVDFDLGKSMFGGSGMTYLSFDWLSKNTQGTRGNLFPLMVNQRFILQESNDQGSMPFYGFLGVGACIIDVAPASTVLAGRFGLGTKLNENFFLEGAFVITGRTKTSNILGNHIGVYLGYKL